ncbi:YvcK family protein, partial [Omnitrophica bacterium]|nr:YvcK family protein [Candidatus Omnitrophota bacterium]
AWLKVLSGMSKKYLKQDLSDAFYQDEYPFMIRYGRLQSIGAEIDHKKALKEADEFIQELGKKEIDGADVDFFKQQLAFWKKDETVSQSARGEYSPLRGAFDHIFEKLPQDFSMEPWPNWTLYAQHEILMQELEARGLQDESVRLTDQIQNALAQTPQEKEYLQAARELYLLKRLFSLELTREEYEEFKDRVTQSGIFNSPPEPIDALITQAMSFYKIAIQREHLMFSNALTKMRQAKQQRAILVTGGFHAQGFKTLAGQMHSSYIQITPRVTEISKRDRDVYLRSVLGSLDRSITTQTADGQTSHMSALLGIAGRAQRAAVVGRDQERAWLDSVSTFIQGLISTEPISDQPALLRSFSRSVFSPEASVFPDLAAPSVRSEARERISYVADVPLADHSVRQVNVAEGGSFSIDIVLSPAPTKQTAMEDFIQAGEFRPEEGYFFGNQNQKETDRDATVANIAGLRAMGVDENQEGIIPGVERIGQGPDATLRKLQEILSLPDSHVPKFIGFDIDDTLLGLRPDQSKETLIQDRRPLADTLVKLAVRGIQLIFLSDNDTQTTLKRIGEPLGGLLQVQLQDTETRTLTFYTSKMVTKSEREVSSPGFNDRVDPLYSHAHRMDSETAGKVLSAIGSVQEQGPGRVVLKGPLGNYYGRTTEIEDGMYVLNAKTQQTYPQFQLQKSEHGNVIAPQVQVRDPFEDGSVAGISILPLVSESSKGNTLTPEQEDERRILINEIARSPEFASFAKRSEARHPALRRIPVSDIIPFGDYFLEIREGGDMTIDIALAGSAQEGPDLFDKRDAMHDFLNQIHAGDAPGYYISSLTYSKDARDGVVTELLKENKGLEMLAVDIDQENVIEMKRVRKIGPGIDATRAFLQKILAEYRENPQGKPLPKYIAISGDDVVIGHKDEMAGGTFSLEMETLDKDREPIARALVELILEGVDIALMTDNSVQYAKENLGKPLHKMLAKKEESERSNKISGSVVFYANGIKRKFTLKSQGKGGPFRSNPKYGKGYRIPKEVADKIKERLGGVQETSDGEIVATGILGTYYTERLAQEEEGNYRLRPSIRTTYPRFDPGESQFRNVHWPTVEIRKGESDHGIDMISLRPFPSTRVMAAAIGETANVATLRRFQPDERSRFFWQIVRGLSETGIPAQAPTPIGKEDTGEDETDHWLIGQGLEEEGSEVVLTSQMLQTVKQLMGVEDLIQDQRLSPESYAVVPASEKDKVETLTAARKQALEDARMRALNALRTMHRRLRDENLTLESIKHVPGRFQEMFGVRPVFVAAGYATRFSSYLHKGMVRAGLRKTNLAYSMRGSYHTPGVKPAIVIGEKVLGQLVRDEYLTGYDSKKHSFKVKEEISGFKPGIRTKPLDAKYFDPDKVQYYLDTDPDSVVFFLTQPYGHGDHLVQVVSLLNAERDKRRFGKTQYVQVAFGEMSPAVDPDLTNASLVTYLEALGQDVKALAAGKISAHGEIAGKGNFFFNNGKEPGQKGNLISYTDWAHIPHKKPISGKDRVARELGEEQQRLEEELEKLGFSLPEKVTEEPKLVSSEKLEEVRKLQRPQEEGGSGYSDYFLISDDGVLFTQELLQRVRDAIWPLDDPKDPKSKRSHNRWGDLSDGWKNFIRSHFAIQESEDGKYADLLISSNTALFENSVIQNLKAKVDDQFMQGFDEFAEQTASTTDGDKKDERKISRFWGIDPKNGETTSLAWNLFGLEAHQDLLSRDNRGTNEKGVGFVYVGNTPSSIKNPERQIAFSAKMAAAQGKSPKERGPLTIAEGRVFGDVRQHLLEGREGDAKRALLSLLGDRTYLNGFRSVVQALLARTAGQVWQWRLLSVLDEIQNMRNEPMESRDTTRPSNAPSSSLIGGLVESLVAEAVDAGMIGTNAEALTTIPDYAAQIVKLRNHYAQTVRKGGRGADYLLEKLARDIAQGISRQIDKLTQLLEYADRFADAHPLQSDMANSRMQTILSVVGNLDDGGSSGALVDILDEAGYGRIPPPGDKGNALSGVLTRDKVAFLMGNSGRIAKDKTTGQGPETFAQGVSPIIVKTIGSSDTDLFLDFFYFARTLMAAVRNVDKINQNIRRRGKREIPLGGASIRNLNFVGFLHENGFFQDASDDNRGVSIIADDRHGDAASKQKHYQKAIEQLVTAAGAKNYGVTVSSFDPKTLYAEYEGYTLLLLDEKTGQKNILTITSRPVRRMIYLDNPSFYGGDIPSRRGVWSQGVEPVDLGNVDQELGISAPGVQIGNEGMELVLTIGGRAWKLDESDLNAIKLVAEDKKQEIFLATDGTGRSREYEGKTGEENKVPLFKLSEDGRLLDPARDKGQEGLSLFLQNRIVKRQTNVTETVNYTRMLGIGLLERVANETNPYNGQVPPIRWGRLKPEVEESYSPLTLEKNRPLFEILRYAGHEAGYHTYTLTGGTSFGTLWTPVLKKVRNPGGVRILIGPGSLMTSLEPHFFVDQMAETLRQARNSGVQVIFVMNAVQDNETNGYDPVQILKHLESVIQMTSRGNIKLDDVLSHLIVMEDDGRWDEAQTLMAAKEETLRKEKDFQDMAALKDKERQSKLAELDRRVAFSVAQELLDEDKINNISLQRRTEKTAPSGLAAFFAARKVFVLGDRDIGRQFIEIEEKLIDNHPELAEPKKSDELQKQVLHALAGQVWEELEKQKITSGRAIRIYINESKKDSIDSTKLLFQRVIEELVHEANLLQAVFPRIEVTIRTDTTAPSDAAKKSRGPLMANKAKLKIIKTLWPNMEIQTMPPEALKVQKNQKRIPGRYEYRPLYDVSFVAQALDAINAAAGFGPNRSEVRSEKSLDKELFTSGLTAKVQTAIQVAASTVSPLVSATSAYAAEIAPRIFAGTSHFQTAAKVPAGFTVQWPVFSGIVSHAADVSTPRLVIDQRRGIPDAASVLPLVAFARYNPKAEVVLALIAQSAEIVAFKKNLAALNEGKQLPVNFKVQTFGNENEFILEFQEFYNSSVPFGRPVALVIDRENSDITAKIGSRRNLLSVVGGKNPLKQTASTLL